MTLHLVVVGSGIAGLYAALRAHDGGAQVTLVTAASLVESNSSHAQGGIAAVLGPGAAAPGDSWQAHARDTLLAGAGYGDRAAVELMCRSAAGEIENLVRYGVRFDASGAPGADGAPGPHGVHGADGVAGSGGGVLLGLEAAHSFPRILHVDGDATGAGIVNALIAQLRTREGVAAVRIVEHAPVTQLLSDAQGVYGVQLGVAGDEQILGDAVLLATGGAAALYARSTNPPGALGQGWALARAVGASVRDAEFIQFHPTALHLPGTDFDGALISEAVRGEGAHLVDARGHRFMPDYDLRAELAPRDVVSRSVQQHLNHLGTPADAVYLDCAPIIQKHGPDFLARRFPGLARTTRAAGIDWTRELVPVSPAAHYCMGGVETDCEGRTSVPGLYAAGEVARTGVHGANRLASNSLLEGLVFAQRAVADLLASDRSGHRFDGPLKGTDKSASEVSASSPEQGRQAVTGNGSGRVSSHVSGGGSFADQQKLTTPALQKVLGASAGMVRSAEPLAAAAAQFQHWLTEAGGVEDPRQALRQHEVRAALDIVEGALARPESLGAHFRSDATAASSTGKRIASENPAPSDNHAPSENSAPSQNHAPSDSELHGDTLNPHHNYALIEREEISA